MSGQGDLPPQGVGADEAELRRLSEACAWRAALHDGDVETTPAFEAWLAADPLHAEAWAATATPLDYLTVQAAAPEAMALREEVLGRARRRQAKRYRPRPSAARVAAGIAAAVVLAAGLGGGAWWLSKPAEYATAFGERRTLTLADGSKVSLDSASLLRVRLRRDRRDLELVRGQARFDVAHDVARPFAVHARDQVVVAVGTSFNVDLLGPKVLVTLLEGRVTILKDAPQPLIRGPGPEPARPVLATLIPGEQRIAAQGEGAGETVKLAAAGLDRAVAWETGQLVFENEPLGAVAERVGRYSATPLSVVGPARDLKISGVFNAGDVATFVDAVQRGLPVTVRQEAGGLVVRSSAERAP